MTARRVAVSGTTGFVGSHIASELTKSGYEVVPLGRTELGNFNFTGEGVDDAVRFVATLPREALEKLLRVLAGVDVVVNAAGAATPGAQQSSKLTNDNVVVPLVIQRAAVEAGVARFIHVSSAAVQGDHNPLDESTSGNARTPYARSKADAERTLQRSSLSGQVSTVIYRPTSVHGAGRSTTETLLRTAQKAFVPIVGSGTAPLPLTTAASVARAVRHLIESSRIVDGVVVHPWEGVTQRMFLEGVSNQRRVVFPEPLVRLGLGLLSKLRVPAIQAKVRRLDVFLLGQGVLLGRLTQDGFVGSSPEEILQEILLADCSSCRKVA